MIASAGGRVLSRTASGRPGTAGGKGVSVVGQLARSPAADPSLGVQMEDQNRLAFETGKAAFEINYPSSTPRRRRTRPPSPGRWAGPSTGSTPCCPRGPRSAASTWPSAPSAATSSRPSTPSPACATPTASSATRRAGCRPPGQPLPGPAAIKGGYPFAAEILDSLQRGGVRPKTPPTSRSPSPSPPPCTRRRWPARQAHPAPRPAAGRHRLQGLLSHDRPPGATGVAQAPPQAQPRHRRVASLSEGPAPSAGSAGCCAPRP